MRSVICPECKTSVVGESVYETSINSGVSWLGSIPCYTIKYDFRKASHVSFGRGYICKKCAKKMFPSGIAYKVTNDYHGKRITPMVGPWRNGYFANKDEAYESAKEQNRRRYDNRSKVEEIKV